MIGGGGGGRGGAGEVQKNILARENEMKKIHARQLTLKNIHVMAYKKFLQLENSPPPYNFSNGPSLIEMYKGSHFHDWTDYNGVAFQWSY